MPAADQGVAVSRQPYHLVPRVLCFVYAGDDVLLLHGAPDKKIWAGKYNGLGGHLERGESVQTAAAREIWEEAGLKVDNLQLRGVVTVDTGEPAGIRLFVFTARALSRATVASAEGRLEWVPLAEVAARDCVEDVPVLLERLAAQPASAPPFSANYRYDAAGRLKIDFAA